MRTLLSRLPRWLMGILMLAGIGVICANVISRYFFGRAIFWAEEALVFMTIWGVFLGMIAITFDGAHLNMDLFSAQLRGRMRQGLAMLVWLSIVAICAFCTLQSWQIVTLFWNTGQVSVAAGLPKAVPHAALLLGFAGATLAALVRWRAYLTGKF